LHWAANGRVDDVNVLSPKEGIEGLGELGVVVVDQEVHGRHSTIQFPANLTGLLGDPD
jgi:hypothetical protein